MSCLRGKLGQVLFVQRTDLQSAKRWHVTLSSTLEKITGNDCYYCRKSTRTQEDSLLSTVKKHGVRNTNESRRSGPTHETKDWEPWNMNNNQVYLHWLYLEREDERKNITKSNQSHKSYKEYQIQSWANKDT